MDKQILIIDDSPHNRQLLRHQLETNYAVLEAPTGQAGMQIFEEQQPDCVFLDLQMPFMDGRTVLQLLRAKNERLPIVIMSNNILECTQLECKSLGATTLLSKPLEAALVQDTCSHLIAN